jgi:lipid II isoglutaminyl synthase (glutamine-hydrolysing)
MTVRRSLRLAHFYPKLMNLYGDRGNMLCLRQRCVARQIDVCVEEISLGDRFDPTAIDLIFMGGGQDREQWRVSDDLLQRKGAALRAAIEAGVPALTVCGGYQLLGRYYQTADGKRLPGLGVYDICTIHPGVHVERCIGNVVVSWEQGELVGFENHGGRTFLGRSTQPLGQVLAGFGNNGKDGTEGCRYRNAFGTYLHGSLLPKNPRFADFLLSIALQRKYEQSELEPLDDRVEDYAHRVAVQLALAEANPPAWAGLLRAVGRAVGA